eukprot:jgi/Bigna1/73159/fgenesh1_pg.23_\
MFADESESDPPSRLVEKQPADNGTEQPSTDSLRVTGGGAEEGKTNGDVYDVSLSKEDRQDISRRINAITAARAKLNRVGSRRSSRSQSQSLNDSRMATSKQHHGLEAPTPLDTPAGRRNGGIPLHPLSLRDAKSPLHMSTGLDRTLCSPQTGNIANHPSLHGRSNYSLSLQPGRISLRESRPHSPNVPHRAIYVAGDVKETNAVAESNPESSCSNDFIGFLGVYVSTLFILSTPALLIYPFAAVFSGVATIATLMHYLRVLYPNSITKCQMVVSFMEGAISGICLAFMKLVVSRFLDPTGTDLQALYEYAIIAFGFSTLNEVAMLKCLSIRRITYAAYVIDQKALLAYAICVSCGLSVIENLLQIYSASMSLISPGMLISTLYSEARFFRQGHNMLSIALLPILIRGFCIFIGLASRGEDTVWVEAAGMFIVGFTVIGLALFQRFRIIRNNRLVSTISTRSRSNSRSATKKLQRTDARNQSIRNLVAQGLVSKARCGIICCECCYS